MRYRVTFMERTGGDGKPSEFPPDYVEIDAADGVILDQVFVERAEPHSERPAGIVRSCELAERRGLPRSQGEGAGVRLPGRQKRRGRIDAPMARMQELERLPVFVHDDDPAARSCPLAIGCRARLPEAQESRPVLGRPALEPDVGGKHGGAKHSASVEGRRERCMLQGPLIT